MVERSVSAAYASGLLELAASAGAKRETLLEQAGIRSTLLADPDARIPFGNYVALMRAARAASNDPALALHYGEVTDISAVSIVGLIGHAAETVAEALAQLNRYVRLVVDVDVGNVERFRLQAEPDGMWLVDAREHPNDFPELTESAFAQLITAPRQLGVPPFAVAVHVTHAAPSYATEYQRIFQAPVVFGSDRNAIQIDESVMTHRLARLPRYAFGVLTEHADALLEQLDSAGSMRGQVERLLVPILHTGAVKMPEVARALNVSRQTLYRRLKREGTTYEQVLDDIRHRLAMRHVRTGQASINQIAYLLGFSDPAAFSRAFKRWTGRSPRTARRESFATTAGDRESASFAGRRELSPESDA